jgi:DNA-binding CsgD family transcriptional regulator
MSQTPPDIDHTIPSIIDDLYAGALDDDTWTRASIAIGDSVGATGIHLFSFNTSTNNVFRDEAHRIDPQLTAAYRDYYCTKDILVDPFLKIAVGEPTPEHKLVSLDAWRKSELFNDLAVPYDMPYVLTTLLHRSPDKFVALSLKTSSQHGPFHANEADRLKLVIPHLRRALEIKDRLTVSQIRADTLAKSLDSLSFGILVVDARGYVIEANAIAEEIFRTPHAGISVDTKKRFHVRDPAGSTLDRWMIAGKPPTQDVDGLLHVPRPSKQPLSLLASPLPQQTKSWIGGDPRWILLLFDPERRTQVSVQLISRDLGISEREAEVAALLVAGYELKGIAARLNISVHTARTHVKTIFAKTGLRSQAELIRRVSSGPAAMGRDSCV